MAKKGQAAMEFLMTYGWAILVVIAAIAALSYFDVFNFSNLLPEKCDMPSGLDCVGKPAITTSDVTIAIRNNDLGFPIVISDARLTDDTTCTEPAEIAVGETTTTFSAIGNSTTVAHQELFKLQWANCTLVQGDKFRDSISLTYVNTVNGIEYTVVGNLKGTVG